MEKAHLRADANVSIRIKGEEKLNTKTEIKNVNSIEAVRTAIKKEAKRQIKEVEAGNEIKPWTLDWDEDTETLRKMRSKETEADYRHFKEPDLLKVHLDSAWKERILADFPELPLARRTRFVEEYELPEYDADILTNERSLSDYFELAAKAYAGDTKRVSNWMMNDIQRMLNESGKLASELNLKPEYLAEIIQLVDAKKVNTPTGKSLLDKVESSGKSPKEIVDEEGLGQVSDTGAIRAIAQSIVDENPDQVGKYKEGKDSLIGWFVGQVMRNSQGKADPNMAREVLLEILAE